MPSVFGETRTFVGRRHALIAPDGHVPSALPGFVGATPYYLISSAMGANLAQLAIGFEAGATAAFEPDERERFFYIEEGEIGFVSEGHKGSLPGGGTLFAPAGTSLRLQSAGGARVACFEKVYQPLDGKSGPELLAGNASQVKGEPFLGNKNAVLQVLLPTAIEWDMAANIFTYQPGATLPFVETHVMEHGLLMLSGQGIYRLEDQYYPVKQGDVIWMAPYCPQWFVAMGDEPASYLYYKNVNRFEA